MLLDASASLLSTFGAATEACLSTAADCILSDSRREVRACLVMPNKYGQSTLGMIRAKKEAMTMRSIPDIIHECLGGGFRFGSFLVTRYGIEMQRLAA